MRGDVVLVRVFGGELLKRRVWDVGSNVVYITNDEQFEKLVAGQRAVPPIGFPKEDVFQVTELSPEHNLLDWSQFVPWCAIQIEMFPTEANLIIQHQQSHKPFQPGRGEHFGSSNRRDTKVRDRTPQLSLLPVIATTTS